MNNQNIDQLIKQIQNETGLFPCDIRKILAAQMGISLQTLNNQDAQIRTITSNGMLIGQPG